MTQIESTTVNDAGFTATGRVGDYDIATDAQGETGPTPNEVLLADYAACFTYAFRAAGMRADEEYGEFGKIQTDAEADIDDEDDLAAVRFTMHVETELDDDEINALLDSAEDICHVHAALREELHADITVHPGAF